MKTNALGALVALFLCVATARGQVIGVTLETTDLADEPIVSLTTGERFKLRVLVEDLRTTPQGVFAAYLDVVYPAAQVTPMGTLSFGSDYPNGREGEATGGLIDDGGAFAGVTPLGGGAILLFEQVFEATVPGEINFSANEADNPPVTDFLVFGIFEAIDPADVQFGTASLNALPIQDLRDFVDTDGAYVGRGLELGEETSYIDISPDSPFPGPGIDLGLSSDDVSTVIDFEALAGQPLTFRIYDQEISGLQVTSNGVIGDPQSVDAALDTTNDCPLPAFPSTGSGFRIYAHHDDLDLSQGGVYYRYLTREEASGFGFAGEPDGISVIQWEGQYFNAPETVDFQVVLGHSSQRIYLQYRTVGQSLGSATVGIQNGDASVGLNVACNGPRIVDDRVVILRPPFLNFGFSAPGSPVAGGTSLPLLPPGELVVYEFVLFPELDASGVTVDVTLPPGLAVLDAVPNRGTFDPLTGLWDLGFLGAGEEANLPIQADTRFSPGTVAFDVAGTTTTGDVPLDAFVSSSVTASASARGLLPFGEYRYLTSFAPEPPPFLSFDDLFVDLVGLGTPVIAPGSDDAFSAPLPLIPAFEFYGMSQADLLVSSNGFVTFDLAEIDADFSNTCPLPDPDAPFPRILALHDDLVLDAGGAGVWYQTATLAVHPEDAELRPATIIQWDEVRHFNGVESWDMEVILFHDSGDILLLIEDGNPERGDSSSVGLQAGVPDPLAALIYQCGDELFPAPDSLGFGDFALFFEAPEPPPVAVNLMLDRASGTEQDETRVTVSVVADEPVNGDQDLELSFSGVAFSDLAVVSGKGMPKLRIADGTSTASRTFEVVDDDEPEGFEIATFRIFGPSDGLTLGPVTELDFTIIDDDVPVLTIMDAAADESADTLSFTVLLSGASPGAFTVPVSILPGTAAPGDDYVDAPGTLSFAGSAGETQAFSVTLNDDAVVELDETLSAILGAPSDPLVTVDDDTGVGTIRNDDSATISVGDVSAAEGDGGEKEFLFPVTIDRAVDVQIVLEFGSADGTATMADGDYLQSSFLLGFDGNAGETQFVPVLVVGDERIEPDETFTLNLSNLMTQGRAVTFADASGLGTIVNDDAQAGNEPPKADDAIFDLAADAATGTIVGTVVASDPDGPLPATGAFSITAGDPSGAFAIDDAGILTVTGAGALPAGGAVELTVTVTDGELSDTATIRIRIGDRIFGDGYEEIVPPPP